MTINYEKVFEADSFPFEILGEEKVRESLRKVLRGMRYLKQSVGCAYVNFGKPIDLRDYAFAEA